ncbi:meiosis expressed gene 1 protein homolog isoform X2 [Balaenoptera acutorostrata]|uniref:Meiosis expressed gene 1 protein homolog isoform X2 n=1 Tax=Balaenoptera acutorostrata TaxID=9767 RepID=A0ABM3TCD2_BALAC|nr:meiosis expressed gene 1 protein homolog isoform X2 [Balaenoptera acutorostrata]
MLLRLAILHHLLTEWTEETKLGQLGHAIRLAGRESRLEDPFPSDIYQMVDEIACALLLVLQGENFAFFGHRQLHNSIFLKLFIFLSKELFQVPFTVFQGIDIFSIKRIL